MASAGSVPAAMGNGSPFNGRQQQTPADMVGNQFVSQFYTVLHSSPRYLHRFYTDESTVTHADFGLDGEPPRSTTVSTQKGISERVMAMGFEEAVTEIWSVDSQYSQNNGVMVMVTGSLQCKGKKKRDFVQSFFLAVQEKGYFVLNDTFRYLSDKSSARPSQYSKENGYIQPDYKGYGQMAGYHPAQHAYYPNHLPAQNSNMYAVHTTPSTYPMPEPVPVATGALQQRSEVTRAAPITPSMPQRLNAPAPAAPKAAIGSPAGQPQPLHPPQTASAPNPNLQQHLRKHLQQAAVVHTTPPPQPLAPAAAPPVSAAALPASAAAQEAPKPAPAAAAAAAAAAAPAAPKQAETAPAPDSAPALQQPKPNAKSEPVDRKSEQAPNKAAEPPLEESESAAPSVPLTYAERLKLGAKATQGKNAPSKPSSAPPKPVQQPARAAATAPAVADSNGPPDVPSTTQPSGGISTPPEEAVTTSIFVRDLPEGINAEKVEAAFSRFGAVKGGVAGVNLKQQRGKEDFAFVEFEEAASMLAAVEGQVIIDGRTVTVMERRPMFPRNLRGPGYQRRDGGGGRDGGRGFRGAPGRDRGRSRGEGRPFPGRGDGRGEGFGGRDGGRGRYGGGFPGDGRVDAGRGREGGRNRGRGEGRGPRAPQSAPPNRPQQAV